MDLDIRPLHPLFAAEVIDVDLRDGPNATLVRQIDEAMDRYAVVVLRDQRIDDDQQLAFARALGPLEPSPAVVDAHLRRLKHREMVDISNLEIDGSILGTEDRRRMFNLVIWDNRCTMHRARAFDDRQFKRDLRRLTLQDSAPTLDQPA